MNIREFKKLIEQKSSIPVESQKLVNNGKMFNDGHSLDNYITSDNQVVYLLGKSWNSQNEKSQTQTNIKSQPATEPSQGSSSNTKPSSVNSNINPLSSLPINVIFFIHLLSRSI